MRIAYFDCFSGVSGNMILGALLDLGLSLDDLRRELARLPLTGYQFQVSRMTRHGIGGLYVNVRPNEGQVERTLADILAIIGQSTLSTETKELSQRIFTRLAEAEARVHNQESGIRRLQGGRPATRCSPQHRLRRSQVGLGRGGAAGVRECESPSWARSGR